MRVAPGLPDEVHNVGKYDILNPSIYGTQKNSLFVWRCFPFSSMFQFNWFVIR